MELRKLSSVRWNERLLALACAFLRELPDLVKRLLRASTRMDKISIVQLLARARANMKDEVMEEGLAVAVVRTTQNDPCGSISCHRCKGPNHFTKDCTPKGRNSRYDVTSAMQWAIYPAIVRETSQGNKPQR